MLPKNKLRNLIQSSSKNCYPETTVVYKPLSAYIAGASDLTGDALKDGQPSMYDEVPDTGTSPAVDPWCDQRMDIFDHIAKAPDFAQQISDQVAPKTQPDTE